MGSMHTGLEEEKHGSQKLAAFYSERARGGVGLIVTGGVSPNWSGRLTPFANDLIWPWQIAKHRLVTDAVHQEGGRIAMQILHAGRYSYHPWSVAPSKLKSAITPFRPRALSDWGVRKTISDFVRCAKLAQKAGYDGVEIMGSEGYLINQFLVTRTNRRTDSWGSTSANRMRFPIEIVRQTRAAVGDKFIIIYRLSMLDLVENGSTKDEVLELAKAIQQAGATILNTGIGWHESRVPTIATRVPRGAFTWISREIRQHVQIPVITTNRINSPENAEKILAAGDADMVSMARPLLADPEFVTKAMSQQSHLINTCIACNQACLDHVFAQKRASCLVNPRACAETEMNPQKLQKMKKIAVVGAGPAGLSFALAASERGHQVVLFEKSSAIGGQLNLAQKIPGKEEFSETIRYFRERLKTTTVDLRLNTPASPALLNQYDCVVLATGVKPRPAGLTGEDDPRCLTYLQVLRDEVPLGARVAILGAGGIGFDVAEFLAEEKPSLTLRLADWLSAWGVDRNYQHPGALLAKSPSQKSKREIFLLQRKAQKMGARLGKTTGWIHRESLKKSGVQMLTGVQYDRFDQEGLHITQGDKSRILKVDQVVICAGQVPLRELEPALTVPVFRIGGAEEAGELDAKRAIWQGTDLGMRV